MLAGRHLRGSRTRGRGRGAARRSASRVSRVRARRRVGRGCRSKRGYCAGSPRDDADSTMRAPGATASALPSPLALTSFARSSRALAAGSTRMPLVDPQSVTHHAPLSSQNSQWRRLAYTPSTTTSHWRPCRPRSGVRARPTGSSTRRAPARPRSRSRPCARRAASRRLPAAARLARRSLRAGVVRTSGRRA